MSGEYWGVSPRLFNEIQRRRRPPVPQKRGVGMRYLLATTVAAGFWVVPFASFAQASDDPFDFAISEEFLRGIKAGNSILYSMQLKMGGHSAIHPLASDCEMHI